MSTTKDLCFSFCWPWIHSKQNITSLSNFFKNLILSTRVDLTKFLIFSARTGGEGVFVFPAKIQPRYKKVPHCFKKNSENIRGHA